MVSYYISKKNRIIFIDQLGLIRLVMPTNQRKGLIPPPPPHRDYILSGVQVSPDVVLTPPELSQLAPIDWSKSHKLS